MKLDIGKLNKIENTYVIVLVLTIPMAFTVGLLSPEFVQNPNIERALDEKLASPEDGTFAVFLKIFTNNLTLGLAAFLTAGMSELVSMSATLFVLGSMLSPQGLAAAVGTLAVVIVTYGVFEVTGFIMLGLGGLSLAERAFKKKTEVKLKRVFILGVVFLLIGAGVEAVLIGLLN